MALLTGLCSCRKNLLDVQPTNLLTTDQIVSSDATISAFMASLYRDMPIEDFSFCKGVFWTFPDSGNQYTADWSDEAAQQFAYSMNSGIYDILYKAIRNVNSFISLVTATTNFPAAQQAQYIAEAKFVRAYYYFGLVKYYGGVPIVLNIPATPVPLPRNKEVEVYNLIKTDLDAAVAGLPALAPGYLSSNTTVNNVSYGYGRANKWVALALEARAMLHGGSIGMFAANDPNYVLGIATFNGIVGVDPTNATIYMQAAYDAANAIITGKVGTVQYTPAFSLYQKYSSPGVATPANAANFAQNFQYLFYDTKQGDSNSESIFNKGYDYATSKNYTHSEDLQVLPHGIESAVGYGNALMPTNDLQEKFEMIDGSSPLIGGTILPGSGGVVGTQYHYASMNAPFAGKDPRFNGTLVANGSFFRGATITAQKGVILATKQINGNNYSQFFDTKTTSTAYKTFQADPSKFPAGDTYIVGTGNSGTGDQCAWLKKWTDPVTDIVLIRDYTSRTSWMDMRYGEVLLDAAEASFELGHATSESLGWVNQIRARAGIPALGTISRALIRHERCVEFAYENKTFWDYIRWRAFSTDFTARVEYNLDCYWDIDTSDYVYIKVAGSTRTYTYKSYYNDIPGGDLSTDALLVHNPGY